MSPIIAAVLILFSLVVAGFLLVAALYDRLSPSNAVEFRTHEQIPKRPDLEKNEKNCERSPCFVVEHTDNVLIVTLYKHAPSVERWQERLITTAQIRMDPEGRPVRIDLRHKPTNDIEDDLERHGVYLPALREHRILYEVNGTWLWKDATIELPVGALPQYFMYAFQAVDDAMEYGTDQAELRRMADIAAAQANMRFGLQNLSKRLRPSQIVFGPVQTATYATALLALCLTILSLSNPKLSRPADAVTDLVPFTGFFGTLIGVLLALSSLSVDDITDDIRKAMTLGLIGNALSLAINTTICAIAVFGALILTQSGLQTAFGRDFQNLSNLGPAISGRRRTLHIFKNGWTALVSLLQRAATKSDPVKRTNQKTESSEK